MVKGELQAADEVREKKKLTGTTKATIKTQITIEDYKNAIYNCKSKWVTNYTFDSKKHHLETREQYKIALHPFDDMGIRGDDGSFSF